MLTSSNYNADYDTGAFAVNKANITLFKVSVNNITYGQYSVIDISAVGVYNEFLNGTAIVKINGVTYPVAIKDGYGKLIIDDLLNAGSYTVDAVLRSANYNVVNASNLFDVNKADTKIVANNLTVTAYIGGKLVATLTDAKGKALIGRNITFVFDDEEYVCTTNAYGKATLSISENVVGSYPVTITFAGDNNYNGASTEVTVKVSAAYVTVKQIITASNYVKKYAAKYKKVPTTVKVGSIKCTFPQYSYLASAPIKAINAKKSVAYKIKVLEVKATNKNIKVSVKATKKQYLSIANSLYAKSAKGTLPSYITVSGKKVGFNDYTVGLARVLAFYSSGYRLPNYVVFTSKY